MNPLSSIFRKKAAAPVRPALPAKHHGAAISDPDLQQQKKIVSKEEWRRDVLPAKLKKYRDDPPGLYRQIRLALKIGLAGDVDDASKRLLEIDTERERSHVTRSVVLMRMKRLPEAEALLIAEIKAHGKSRIMLTNLSKVYDELGDSAKAEQTLRDALALPQCSNASLNWWGEIQADIGGESAHLDMLQRTAAIRGSWLPQLWQARHGLQNKDLKRALETYKRTIATADGDADTLAVISGDFLRYGLHREMIDVLEPLYRSDAHGPLIGLNLLKSHLEIGDIAGGKLLLHEMFKHYRNDLRKHLQHYAAEFARAATGRMDQYAVDAAIDGSSLFSIELPLWWYGLMRPNWMLPGDKKESVLLLSFTRTGADGAGELDSRITNGMCHALPMLLAESLLHGTPFKPVVSLPIANGFELGVAGREWRLDEVMDSAKSLEPRPTLALTGNFDEAAKKLSISVYDVQSQKCAAVLRYSGLRSDLGWVFVQIQEDVRTRLGITPATRYASTPWFSAPAALDIAGCLRALELTLTIFLQHNELTPKTDNSAVLSELRELATGAQTTSLHGLLFAAALLMDDEERGGINAPEYQALRGLVGTNRSSIFFRLSPYFMKIYADEGFDERRDELLAQAADDYRTWLDLICEASEDFVVMDV
jgi:tetratricopeptide (TPR) repeat protein